MKSSLHRFGEVGDIIPVIGNGILPILLSFQSVCSCLVIVLVPGKKEVWGKTDMTSSPHVRSSPDTKCNSGLKTGFCLLRQIIILFSLNKIYFNRTMIILWSTSVTL